MNIKGIERLNFGYMSVTNSKKDVCFEKECLLN